MKSMDLSKFKKISSDKKMTTLQHPDGHTIKIAHAVLKPEMKAELDKIPLHKASGGMIPKYAEGTDSVSADDSDSQDQTQPKQSGPVVINVGAQAQPQQQAQQMPQQQPPQQPQAPQAAAPQAPLDIVPAPEMNQQQAQQSKDATESEDNDDTSNEQDIETPTRQPAADQSAPVDNGAPQSQPEQTPYQKSYQDYVQAHQKEFAEQDAAFAQDLQNGHITPETYGDLFAKKSTLGKIGMIFGMMASGAGSGLTHQPNALLQMMNNEIQNDLDAQKQSKGNAQNMLRLNQQQHMNEAQIGLTGAQQRLASAEANTKAYAMTNMQMNRAALDKIAADVKRLPPGSPERARQEQALGMMYNSVNNENFNIGSRAASAAAYYNTLMGNTAGGGDGSDEQRFQQKTNGMRMLGPQGQEMAKNIEDKHFPGLKGQASVPLSGEDRSSINSGIDFDQKLHRFMDWTKNHSGDLNPTDKNAGQALAAELQGAYRQATHGGVYKEGEQNFISKLIDQTPTKFFNSVRVMPQLNAIAGENQARVNQLVKSKGFQGYSNPSTSQSDSSQGGNTIERVDPKSGRTVIYDATTKKPLRWK